MPDATFAGAARYADMLLAANDRDHPLAVRFADFIGDPAFPCVGAKAAHNRQGMRFIVGRDFKSAWDDLRIVATLLEVARDYGRDPEQLRSLVVLFEGGAPGSEAEYERQLWVRLQSIAHKDEWLGQPVDPKVSDDPADPHFAMSFGGEGFFVVGLHPKASRPARRFDVPAMVFNLQDQFERLRADGRYGKMSATIRQRDVALAGSENPMLADHGTISAARQYSGRLVADDWVCPFSGRNLQE